MTYNITIKNKNHKQIETAEGVKDLQTKLALFRAQGWEIKDVSRAKVAA